MSPTDQRAYLNWRMSKDDRASNYAAMGEGYAHAALRLIDSLLEDNVGHEADAVIFPALFCAHQSIELYLKAARIAAREATGINPWKVKNDNTHDLERLLSSLNSCIDNDQEKLKRNPGTAPLFDLIDLLRTVGDDKAGGYFVDFARYPEKGPGQLYLFVNDDKLIFELPKIRKLINDGCGCIEGYFSLWQERVDCMRTAKAESLHSQQ